jgi:hypothetical protein
MRIPGTKHSRTGNLAEMNIEHVLAHDYTLDQMRHALAPYMGAQVIPLTPRGKLAGPNAELAGGIETPKALPINIDTVAQAGCGFIAEALSTGGAGVREPAVEPDDARLGVHRGRACRCPPHGERLAELRPRRDGRTLSTKTA